jgi:hypothetical protein
MRRDRCLVGAVAGEPLGVLETRGLVGWSVVHPWEQVEMQVDMGHAVVRFRRIVGVRPLRSSSLRHRNAVAAPLPAAFTDRSPAKPPDRVLSWENVAFSG